MHCETIILLPFIQIIIVDFDLINVVSHYIHALSYEKNLQNFLVLLDLTFY